MLLFSDKNKPEENSDVVHFAAKTPRTDGFFKYSYNGLTGKYNGYFIREPFFKKLYEYNTLEQRYLHTYELNYTKEEIKFLIYHLFELRKATFKYYFFDANCASQITDLISVIDSKNIEKSKGYYLPIYTISDFENRITSVKSHMPIINKIDFLTQKMTSNEKNEFYKFIKNSNKVDENYSDILKEAIQLNTILNFKKFNKVDKNYQNTMSQTFIPTLIDDKNLHPLKKTKPSTYEVGYIKKDDDFLSLKYRPIFLELKDFQYRGLQKSEINALTFELLLNEETSKLNYLNILSIRSLPKQLGYYNPLSWNLYLGVNRQNYTDNIKLNTEVGFGRSTNLIGNIHSSLLFNLGSDNEDFYIKPYLYFDYEFKNNIKISATFDYKSYVSKNYYYSQDINIMKKINNNYINFEVSNKSTNDNLNYKLSYIYNF